MSSSLFLTDISQMLTLLGPPGPRRGRHLREVGLVTDAAILIQAGRIAAVGKKKELIRQISLREVRHLSLGGHVVLPGFVDSHAHPLFLEPRLQDFEKRLEGQSYARIAREGGGILHTVSAIRKAGPRKLTDSLRKVSEKFLSCGTTTLEAKSGYGLSHADEIKMLRAFCGANRTGPLELIPTFLGAHAFPPERKKNPERYLRDLQPMIREVAEKKLAEFVDVFCEKGYFSLEQTRRIFETARKTGLRLKIHAGQFSESGAVRLAVEYRAVSADHLDHLSASDIQHLARSSTLATLLPGSNFFLGSSRYPPARRLIEAGAAVALATDFNPGTSPTWNMQNILSIACTQMRMRPEEVLSAATINGAYALGCGHRLGSLEPGKQADLIALEVRDYREIPYHFGANHCALTIKKGRIAWSHGGKSMGGVRPEF